MRIVTPLLYEHSFIPEFERTWKLLTYTITAKFQGTGIPILDLSKVLYKEYDKELIVHPVVDAHPNDIAHAIASREILSFLQQQKLIAP